METETVDGHGISCSTCAASTLSRHERGDGARTRASNKEIIQTVKFPRSERSSWTIVDTRRAGDGPLADSLLLCSGPERWDHRATPPAVLIAHEEFSSHCYSTHNWYEYEYDYDWARNLSPTFGLPKSASLDRHLMLLEETQLRSVSSIIPSRVV